MLSLAERCAVGRATGLMRAVASGSGGPSAEPAPETEVKGSGERPLAEAAALEIDPERLTESHHHTTLRLNVDPIATAVSHAHTMSHSLAFPSLIEAFHIFWLYQLPLQAAAWGQLHRCFQDWSSSVCSELGVPASVSTLCRSRQCTILRLHLFLECSGFCIPVH